MRAVEGAPEGWGERWGLVPFTAPCQACGEPLTTTVPVMLGNMPGLAAPVCRCGNERTPYGLLLGTLEAQPLSVRG